MEDVESIITSYKEGGKPAAMGMFDEIAKAKKMKVFETHMLVTAFQRECKARDISL